jgi:hypothetical protein
MPEFTHLQLELLSLFVKGEQDRRSNNELFDTLKNNGFTVGNPGYISKVLSVLEKRGELNIKREYTVGHSGLVRTITKL